MSQDEILSRPDNISSLQDEILSRPDEILNTSSIRVQLTFALMTLEVIPPAVI